MGSFISEIHHARHRRKCPETAHSASNSDDLLLPSVEPGANINPHQGDTDAIYRCHLGLSVPGGLDCGFQVGAEIRGWKEGRLPVTPDPHRME